MDGTLKVQAQIRQNAEEISSYLTDMSKWEKTIIKKDQQIRGKTVGGAKPLPIRAGSGTVKVVEKSSATSQAAAVKTATQAGAGDGDMLTLTPATLATQASAAASPVVEPALKSKIPAARGVASTKDAETSERERGNLEYETGNFTAAVKSYTKCLGLKNRNYVAFSNRAMAYIKLKEYLRADSDCKSALAIEPTHVKSLIRRATSRNALGKHRAALQDLLAATDLEPANKQVRMEMQRTKEMLRSAVNRAPLVPIKTTWFEAGVETADATATTDENTLLQGPDLPYPGESVRMVIEEIESDEVGEEKTSGPESELPPVPIITPVSAPTVSPVAAVITPPAAVAAPVVPVAATAAVNTASTASVVTAATAAVASSSAPKTVAAAKAKKDSKTTKTGPAKGSTVLKGYELERELKVSVGDDAALARLFAPLKPAYAGKMFERLMEADVVTDFLAAAGRYYLHLSQSGGSAGTSAGTSAGAGTASAGTGAGSGSGSGTIQLINWFDAISLVTSFRMVKALLSNEQRQKLDALLVLMATRDDSDDGVRSCIDVIRVAWDIPAAPTSL